MTHPQRLSPPSRPLPRRHSGRKWWWSPPAGPESTRWVIHEKSWKWTKKNPVSKMAFRGKSLNQMRGSLNLWDFPACDWISALENGMISVAGMSQSRRHLWRFIPLTLHGYATRPWNLRKLYSTLQFQYIQYMFCIGLLYFIIIQRWPNLLP